MLGRNDLGQPILVDTTEAINNTPKTPWLFSVEGCATIYICQIQIINGCCDLENDVKVKLIIWYEGLGKDSDLPIEKDYVVKSH